ncbi:glycosyltransferase family 2 protein [Flavobacterium psychrotolerans]|uniref:Glycosyl transferase n=1 Tax=Flavobacterium psychrotolerans TaxID=2169410 RepID=A0A2U1JKG3_9FLAO|nr:glycosyltransferase [Flavobacterium psychrotolerans]PWA05651.1 glycosyl transferase [Flavobacterium psychrotolerans]
MTLIIALILFIYVLTIGHLIYGFDKIHTYKSSDTKPKTHFAIIVPFRNESANLPQLLESFKNLNYPKTLFEIILVDDFSEDDSVKLIYNWRMKNGEFHTTLLENLRISNSPKKDAITRAIPIIKNEWVITTDADCVVPENWLLTLDNYVMNHDVSMIVGSVSYECKKSFLHHFQQLDLISLQGATMGSFGIELGFMCNGANFCYTKSLFQELNGFAGNNKMASGDDVFLLQKAVQSHPGKVHYLKSKSNIVTTKPMNSWKSLFHQRARWASKTGSYQSLFGKDLAVIVFVGNLGIVLGFGFWVSAWLPWHNFAIFFLIKFIFDFVLLNKTNSFLTKKRIRFLILSSLLYPFFCVSVALFSLFGKYEWKGRRF